jgi:hypothetical protein
MGRAILVLAASLSVGCGGSVPTERATPPREHEPAPVAVPGKQKPAPDAVPQPPPVESPGSEGRKPRLTLKRGPKADFVGRHVDILDTYFDNEVKAEISFKGKTGTVDVEGITKIGRTESGWLYIAAHNFLGESYPNVFFYFPPEQAEEVAKLSTGGSVRVEGLCDGKIPDSITRGNRVPNSEWHVDFLDCRIVGRVPARQLD